MPTVVCFNPGSNSLKFDIIEIRPGQSRASQGQRLLTGTIDNIGKATKLEITRGTETILSKQLDGGDFASAVNDVFDALEELKGQQIPGPEQIDLAAVRVVHGGDAFRAAVQCDDRVLQVIESRAELAPLHNPNALKVIACIRKRGASLPVSVAFDTAFHHALPEHAWRYPIESSLADRWGIRKFGFHGLSHRYLLEQYAHLRGKPIAQVSAVTMHLESGSSMAAIQNGHSIETSMGFTPLEGLMMGTRCGSIDPAIVPYLINKEGLSAESALEVLEKKSGLLGISAVSLDTRVLRKRDDAQSVLAMKMFSYRARQMAGAYLAVLGDAEAIVFGGGIGENTPEVRSDVCAGLRPWGLELDHSLNESTMSGDICISAKKSSLQAWVIHSDEGMQLAYECAETIR